MEKILVTGGAGFLGSNYIYYLLRHRSDVSIVGLDSLGSAGNLRSLKAIMGDPNFRFVKGDITDKEQIEKLFREESFDVVVNFAESSRVNTSVKTLDDYRKVNVEGLRVLLDAFNQYGIARFHQVSTDEVYGSVSLDDEEACTEESPLNPGNPYAVSKAEADALCLEYYEKYGTPISISRCCNSYGPRQFPGALVATCIVNGTLGKEIPIYGDGQNVRTWLYVQDHARAIDTIVHEGRFGEVYNIDGTDEYANVDLAQELLEHLGVDTDLITFEEDPLKHETRYSIDDSKLVDELGWEPEKDTDTGLDRTIDWYRRHEDWWQSILDGSYLEYEQTLAAEE